MIRRNLTKVTPAAVTRLAELATFKSELGETGNSNDALYGRVLDICSNEIAAYLNGNSDDLGDVTLGRETYSETIYGVDGVSELILGRWPLGDVESVSEGGVTIARLTDTDEANPAFDYVVKKASGLVWKPTGRFSGNVVTVVYSAGWLLPGETGRTLPLALEDACLRFARVKLDQLQDGDDMVGPLTETQIEGVGRFQFAGQSSSAGRGLPYEVRNLIERYKAPSLA